MDRVLVAGVCVLAACMGGTRRADRPRPGCVLAAADSALLRGRALYPECAVDREAELVTPGIVAFQGDGSQSCVSAVARFVVDTTGRVEPDGARLLRASDVAFGEALIASLPAWRYRPARLRGRPVRQMVTAGRTAATSARNTEPITSPNRRRTLC